MHISKEKGIKLEQQKYFFVLVFWSGSIFWNISVISPEWFGYIHIKSLPVMESVEGFDIKKAESFPNSCWPAFSVA